MLLLHQYLYYGVHSILEMKYMFSRRTSNPKLAIARKSGPAIPQSAIIIYRSFVWFPYQHGLLELLAHSRFSRLSYTLCVPSFPLERCRLPRRASPRLCNSSDSCAYQQKHRSSFASLPLDPWQKEGNHFGILSGISMGERKREGKGRKASGKGSNGKRVVGGETLRLHRIKWRLWPR